MAVVFGNEKVSHSSSEQRSQLAAAAQRSTGARYMM
jgi:hypothetical protein